MVECLRVVSLTNSLTPKDSLITVMNDNKMQQILLLELAYVCCFFFTRTQPMYLFADIIGWYWLITDMSALAYRLLLSASV